MMIISHHYQFIFAKNRKVAGSSVEKFLLPYLNHEIDEWYGDRSLSDVKNRKDTQRGLNVYGKKDPHSSICDVLDDNNKNYLKFVIVRNPWDQYISVYDHQKFLGHKCFTPEEFFDLNYQIYLDITKQIVLVDKFLHYESLTGDLCAFCNKFGIKFDKPRWMSTRLKTISRKQSIKEFYDKHEHLINEVEKAAWFHVKHLNYKFPED